ncbi:MAG: A/G-specific adenine glycosylase [Flavobacteriales bacterium]|nr:A/G-specific adenine glycosylase [Flavobacteriales bacterium]
MRFSEDLIHWYKRHKRDLPWRNTTDPYVIWLSEIILQQTRVDQGIGYFHRFLERFPDVFQLAEAHEDDVLKLWQGLGYYSRARNLHATAQVIAQEYNGHFPGNYHDLLKLKGVGEYTAAAIASFAFREKQPVVDGNVYRVLSRVFGIDTPIDSSAGKKMFRQLAADLIPDQNPDTFNQAIMEFGALHCVPKSPDCEACIFLRECYAKQHQLTGELPKKAGKTKQRDRYFNYLVVMNRDHVYLHQRQGKDIWKGLHEFPLIETETPVTDFEALLPLAPFHSPMTLKSCSQTYKHILSHQRIFAVFWLVTIESSEPYGDFKLIPIREINKYAVPKLIDNYIQTWV